MFCHFSPDELPFPITDELIKLPGYKPKLCPPKLPPKERQRRHSDSVTTLTDSGVTTLTPFVEEDPIVQERLRPKHNSANTAIYHEYVHISYSSRYNLYSF